MSEGVAFFITAGGNNNQGDDNRGDNNRGVNNQGDNNQGREEEGYALLAPRHISKCDEIIEAIAAIAVRLFLGAGICVLGLASLYVIAKLICGPDSEAYNDCMKIAKQTGINNCSSLACL